MTSASNSDPEARITRIPRDVRQVCGGQQDGLADARFTPDEPGVTLPNTPARTSLE
ncbi:hypothetical protein [Pseudonocardia adelaidensis]|uniref:hypothetical protein n=1 Tax=Pseudonocardia adelaidensis TaxID=648754 RepID=UPI0031EB0EAB